MATKYLRSSATGAANGNTMADAYTTLAAAIAGLAAGDTLLVAHDTVDNYTASQTFTFPGTLANPNIMVSVNAGTEAYQAGAQITTTGNFHINIGGNVISDGVSLNAGIGATVATNITIANITTTISAKFRNCTLTTPPVLNSRVSMGGNGSWWEFDNVTVACQNINGYSTMSRGVWRNSICYSGTIPTYLHHNVGAGQTTLYERCDLSAFEGKTIRQTVTGTAQILIFNECKLPTSFTVYNANSVRQDSITFINCSRPDGKVMAEDHRYNGNRTLSDTVYRTGGATDGAANYSCKITTVAGASRHWPVPGLEVSFRVGASDVGVAKTLTAYLVTDNVTLAANEAWLEVDYLADAASLRATTATSGPANSIANGTAPATDSTSTWTTTGLTTPVKQKVSVTFTPAKAGMHVARVMVGKASTTVYADLKVVLT